MLEFSSKKLYIINYCITVVIVIACLIITRDIISITFSKKSVSGSASGGEQTPANSMRKIDIMEYSSILEKNPFGRPMKLTQISAVQENTAKDLGTLSNLVLLGTVVGPPQLSYAIFEDTSQAGGKQDVFLAGNEVFNYGTLKTVQRTYVDIMRNAETFTLTMPDDTQPSQEQPVSIQETDTQHTTFARKIGDTEYLLDRRKVQESIENPEQILTDARLLPNFKDGKQEGFSMSEVIPGGLYHSLGLKNGDILLRINGLEMSNPEVAIQAMSALRGMDTVTLDIVRSGNNMSLSYQIR